MSSGLGSLTQSSDPAYVLKGPASRLQFLQGCPEHAKVLFASELSEAGSSIKVTSADPASPPPISMLNGPRSTRTVREGARITARLETLTAGVPTGRFFNDEGPVVW
jgi:hypothetical protein